MEEKIKAELKRLIEEGETLKDNIKIRSSNMMTSYRIEKPKKMHEWIDASETIIKNFFNDSYENLKFSQFSYKDDYEKLLARLKTELNLCNCIPNYINSKKKKNVKNQPNNITINNTQNQSQNQEQSQTQKIIQEVFLEAIKDELTGKQQKEIKAILEEHKDNIEEAKPKLIEKLASFGTNVLANVVSNILTNPIMSGLF